MASWILLQQWLLSLIILALIFNERHTSRFLGGSLSYSLWLVVPLALVINGGAQFFSYGAESEITRYIVSLNAQSTQVGELISWQVIWAVGALIVGGISIKATLVSRFNRKLSSVELKGVDIELPKQLGAYQSEEVSGPMLVGILSPKLVLPSDFHNMYNPTQQQLILEHELCHYHRKDNLINLLVVIGLSCCWFNPIAWIGYRSFRKSQEIACDSYVLNKKSSNERLEYGKALINCAQSAQLRLCIDSNYTQRNIMFKRISMLKNHQLVNRPAQFMATLLAGIVMTSVAFASPPMPKEKGEKIHPEVRIEPRYPIQAAKDKIEGSVVLKFDIMADGSVMNISVVKSVPAAIFDKESRRALKQWKYKASANGASNVHVQLDFRMGKSATKPVDLMADIEKISVRS